MSRLSPEKPKIFIFAGAIYTPNTLSGGDRRFIEIARRINDKFDINLITSEAGHILCKNEKLAAKYWEIPFKILEIKNIPLTYFIRSFRILPLLKKIQSENDTILYSPSDRLPDVLSPLVSKLLFKKKNAKWIQVIHHMIPHPSKRKGSYIMNFLSYLSQKISLRWIRKYCDLVIVVNPYIKDILVNDGFDKEKIDINLNGIDYKFAQSVKPAKMGYDAVYVGRVYSSKGVDNLINIWADVVDEVGDAKLGLIGECRNPNKKIIEDLISKNKLEKNVDILGYLQTGDMYSVLKSSKLFTFPSKEEGFGIVILEAMACGLPSVAWDLDVYKHVFGNKICAVGFENREFSDKILELLKDEKLRKKVGRESLIFAGSFDWDEVARNEVKLIKEILN